MAQGLLALGLLAMGGLEVAKIFGNFSGALMALPSLLLTACWLKIIREDGKDLLHTYRAKDCRPAQSQRQRAPPPCCRAWGRGFALQNTALPGLNGMFHTPRKIAIQRLPGECPL